MQDSAIQSAGYAEILDYRMSEKFGLDWKEYDNQRMQEFIAIMGLDARRERKEHEKAKAKQKK